MFNRRKFGAVAAIAAAGLFAAATVTPAQAEYPERPITLIVPWGAGGGTDATGRMIASLLEGELGQPVNVVNRTGGSGVVGHSAIANAKPDGYTIGVATVEIGMMHWAGLTELTGADYTPIALYNYDAAGLIVSADSEWETASDVIAGRRRHRDLFGRRGRGPYRGGQGKGACRDGQRTPRRFRRCADSEGGNRLRLADGRLARACRP